MHDMHDSDDILSQMDDSEYMDYLDACAAFYAKALNTMRLIHLNKTSPEADDDALKSEIEDYIMQAMDMMADYGTGDFANSVSHPVGLTVDISLKLHVYGPMLDFFSEGEDEDDEDDD